MSEGIGQKYRVVILGGGFGGLNAAQALKHAPVEITLLDRRNFHLFQPLLYQVATGSLSPGQIAAPLRSVLSRQKNVQVLLGDAVDVDPAGRRVTLRDKAEIPYDFLIGDLALVFRKDGRMLPGIAPVAMQEGAFVARAIRARLAGTGQLAAFRYRDKGDMAVIGRAAAVANIFGLHLAGMPAWLVWLFIHLMYIVEFQNRVLVFIQWGFEYLTFSRGARLITGVDAEDSTQRPHDPRSAPSAR